jgi:putative protease
LAAEARPDVNLHISTQQSTANSGSAAFWKRNGARRVVLARECTIANAKEITSKSDIEVEMFVHGAMCVAVSGRCLLSAYLCGQSGSRGECKHSCRWEWKITESMRPDESLPVFETGKETIFLGSKDLCLVEHIPALVEAGLSSLKIEGRMKSEYYVAVTTAVFREAIDEYFNDPEAWSPREEWIRELESVSHRPFSTGFAFGYPEQSPQELQTHNKPVSTHEYVAFTEEMHGEEHLLMTKNVFSEGEALEWMAPGGNKGETKVLSIRKESGAATERAHCGTRVLARLTTELPPCAILRRRR